MSERSRLSLRDLIDEALAGVLQRPGRSALTMLGTLLGVGAFVAILGLTATAGGQIDRRFTELAATEVTVEDVGLAEQSEGMSFPADASARVQRIDGVVHAGVYWEPDLPSSAVSGVPGLSGDGSGLAVFAADPEALAAAHPAMRAGRVFNAFHQSRGERVAVVGGTAAARLGLGPLELHPAVFLNGTPYTVIGVVDGFRRLPELMMSVMIPSATALKAYGSAPGRPAKMLIETRLGAATIVAAQVPVALRPEAPQRFKTIAPPDPQTLRRGVAGDFDALFLLLAAISLVIGAVGIANTTFVSVLERTNEIGLRRALGARPVHIAAQFLAESAALGALGGLIGTATGVGLVVSVAIANSWTAILQPWTVVAGPLAGMAVGLAAGLYPATRAARIQPITALHY